MLLAVKSLFGHKGAQENHIQLLKITLVWLTNKHFFKLVD